jgi:hypothetical protein
MPSAKRLLAATTKSTRKERYFFIILASGIKIPDGVSAIGFLAASIMFCVL